LAVASVEVAAAAASVEVARAGTGGLLFVIFAPSGKSDSGMRLVALGPSGSPPISTYMRNDSWFRVTVVAPATLPIVLTGFALFMK
jgi:hypothetical protein